MAVMAAAEAISSLKVTPISILCWITAIISYLRQPMALPEQELVKPGIRVKT